MQKIKHFIACIIFVFVALGVSACGKLAVVEGEQSESVKESVTKEKTEQEIPISNEQPFTAKPVTYTISFDKNAVDAVGAIEPFALEYGEVGNLPLEYFQRMGYDQIGWNTDSLATTVKYKSGTEIVDLVSAEYSAVTLYAVWQAKQTEVTIMYGAMIIEQVTATYDKAMPELFCGVPLIIGKNFLGYFDSIKGGVKYYNSNLTSARNWDKVIASVYLFAQYA